MGYYTVFNLTVLQGKNEVTEVDYPEFKDKVLYDGDLSIQELIDQSTESMKWYNHNEDMLKVSEKFPDLVFILDGDGEEIGDVWREFYKNGKSYSWTLKVKRPDFDPSKLH